MSLMSAFKAFWRELTNPQPVITEQKPETAADTSHLRLLALLQNNSRLVDFLKEDISSFDDAQVGAVVRKLHADSAKTLEEVVTIRPIMQENEGAKVQVPRGYDPTTLKLIGNVKGEPPFSGTVIHKGWKAHKRSLPKKSAETNDIIYPAEIEIK